MGNSQIIAFVPDGTFPFSLDEFAALSRQRWSAISAVYFEQPPFHTGVNVQIEPTDESFFQIDYWRDRTAITTDGTIPQRAEVAAWVRSLLPADAPRLIAFDTGWFSHVELVHGITAEDFLANVVDHSVPGWNEGDPDLF